MRKITRDDNYINLKKIFKNPNDVNKEIKEVKENFNGWLTFSDLSIEDFVKCASADDFKIIKEEYNDMIQIQLLIKNKPELQYKMLGEMISFNKCDDYGRYSAILLLLYISSRLDESNQKKEKEFFWEIAKKFCRKIVK